MNRKIIVICSLVCTWLVSCNMSTVHTGSIIKIIFTLTTINGTRIDASYIGCGNNGSEPLPVKLKAGKGWLVPAWDSALLGMHVNEEKLILLPPCKAWMLSKKNPYPFLNDTLLLKIKVINID